MIIVTVGSSPGGFSFHRLIQSVDRYLLQQGREGWMQIGSSRYLPRVPHTRFVSQAELRNRVLGCDLVIGHCGAGTLLLAREMHRKLCVLPRKPELDEIRDEHQIRLAENLSHLPWVEVLQESTLESQISRMLELPPDQDLWCAQSDSLGMRLREYLFPPIPEKEGCHHDVREHFHE